MSTYTILVTNNAPGCNNEIEQQLSVAGCSTYIVRLTPNSNALGPFNVYVDSTLYYSDVSRNDLLDGVIVTLECATPTQTPSPTPTPLNITPTQTKTPTPTPSITPTNSLTPTNTTTPTQTQTPTLTPTPSVTIGLTPSATQSQTPTTTATPTYTPTNTTTATQTPTTTTTATQTPTTTETPTNTPTQTLTQTSTPTQTPAGVVINVGAFYSPGSIYAGYGATASTLSNVAVNVIFNDQIETTTGSPISNLVNILIPFGETTGFTQTVLNDVYADASQISNFSGLTISAPGSIYTYAFTTGYTYNATPTPTPAPTTTPTPTTTVTQTVTPSQTATNTETPTQTPTQTPTVTTTQTPTNTASDTPTQTPTVTTTQTPTNTASDTPTQTPTPTLTPTNTASQTVTPTNTLTPTNTASETSTPTVTPTNTTTPTNTASETPTQTPTTTTTDTPTQTPTVTSTQTPTNTTTDTPTQTPTETQTQTPTNTETPTQTPTPTITNTPTQTNTPTLTQTPTPTNQAFFAYLFIDTSATSSKSGLTSWMTSKGSTWKGFNTVPTAPSTTQATFDAQMNAYLSYTGWTGNLAAGGEPAIIQSPICLGGCSGNDAYGNPIVQNVFQTVQIPIGAFTATSSNWVTVIVPTGATPGQKYSTIKNGTSAGAMVSRTMTTTYNSLIINYSGSTNIPAGVYRMYSTYTGTDFSLGTSTLPNYFQGGTLVSA